VKESIQQEGVNNGRREKGGWLRVNRRQGSLLSDHWRPNPRQHLGKRLRFGNVSFLEEARGFVHIVHDNF